MKLICHGTLIDMKPLQERAERLALDTDWGELAARGDWIQPNGKPDTAGIKSALCVGNYPNHSQMQESTLLKLCDALLLDPVDVGL